MTVEIAVLLDDKGEIASFYDKSKLVIFGKSSGRWNVIRELVFEHPAISAIKDLRKNVEDILIFMADCKVFVGNAMRGLPSFILEQAGCIVWECRGNPLLHLDYIGKSCSDSTMAKKKNR